MPITPIPTKPFGHWECSNDLAHIAVWRERGTSAPAERYAASFHPNVDLLCPRRWGYKEGFTSHRAAVQWALAMYVELASNEAAAAAQLARSYAEGATNAADNTD